LRGALGSFAARINYAYCLGLISPDEFVDLHLMRKIRNYFAHGKEECSFDDEEVKSMCGSLKTIRKNPLQSDENWAVYWDSATVLSYILSERTDAAQERKCIVQEEFDPAKWRDF
jgi:DNA-binding MltR family transcriptional regulator